MPVKLTWNACLKVGASVFALYLCIHFWPAAVKLLGGMLSAAAPLLIGCVIAYILNLPMSAFERIFWPNSKKKFANKIRRPVCVVAAVVALLAIVALVVWLVVPQLVSCVQLLIDEVPDFFNRQVKRMKELGIFSPEVIGTLENIDWPKLIDQIGGAITSGIGDMAEAVYSAVSSVFSGVVTGVVSVIFSVYLLLGKETLFRQYHKLVGRYVKESWYRKVDYVADVLNKCFRRFIVGQCTEALILGVLCMVGMWILRLPYASMIGALIAFTALVPVVGAFIGGAVGAFMILTVSPVKALVFLIFLVILQQLEGNIIYPKVVGTSLGLPAIWVLAAVTVGGSVLGVGGMLLGVPVAAAVYRIVREQVNKEIPKQTE